MTRRWYGPQENNSSNDEADHGWANPMFQQDHAAKLKAQGRGNGRTHATVTSSTNRQASREEKALEKGAKALNGMCRTGAKVTGGNLYGGYVEYEFNGDHGFGRGRTGHVEVVNNRVVRIHG